MLFKKFESIVSKYGYKVAYDSCQKTYTYNELYQQSCDIAYTLSQTQEIINNKNERIGLLFDNSVEFVATLFACAFHNLSICLLNGSEPIADINKYCNIANISAVITDIDNIEDLNVKVVFILASINEHWSSFSDIIPMNSKNEEFVTQFSSGSTGIPKGIVISQNAVVKRAEYFSRSINVQDSDIFLCVLTFTHAHGSDVLMWPALLNGATLVAPKGINFTARKIDTLLTEKLITIFSSLPLHYDMLVKRGIKADRPKCRLFMSASAPLSSQTGETFKKLYGLPITQAYGNTEFGVICVNDNKDAVDLRVGKVLSGIHWTQSRDGELLVKSDVNYLKYLLQGNKEEKRDSSKWFNTYDVVSIDQDQKLSIVDRTSSFINVTGNKVSPSEVEDELKDIKGINDACVFGLKGDNDDEQVIACVIPEDGQLKKDWIRAQLVDQMSSYKIPSKIMYFSKFPMTSVGKVLRREVKEMYLKECSIL